MPNREHFVPLPVLTLAGAISSGALTFLVLYVLDYLDWAIVASLTLLGGTGTLLLIGAEGVYHCWATRRLERHQARYARLELRTRRLAMETYLGQLQAPGPGPVERTILVNGVPKPFMPVSLSPNDQAWRKVLRAYMLTGGAAGGFGVARMVGEGRLFRHSGHWSRVTEVAAQNEFVVRPGQGQPVTLGGRWTLEGAIGYLDNGLPLSLPKEGPPAYDPLALGRAGRGKAPTGKALADPYPEGPPEEEQDDGNGQA